LIAIDVVRGFPDRVARRAAHYAMPSNKSVEEVKGELQGVLASELTSRKITYTRSDGSPWTLSLQEVLDRAVDYEMAYNPNDCVDKVGRAGKQPGGIDLQAACAASTAREDGVGIPQLVPRATLADAQLDRNAPCGRGRNTAARQSRLLPVLARPPHLTGWPEYCFALLKQNAAFFECTRG